ncbi:MAG: hypothetical protein R2801_03195 [Chitinophagales bacterium]
MKTITYFLLVIILCSSCKNYPFNKKPFIQQPKKIEKAFNQLETVTTLNNNLVKIIFDYESVNFISANQSIHFFVVDSTQQINNYTYCNKMIIGPNKVSFSLKGGTIKDILFDKKRINFNQLAAIAKSIRKQYNIYQVVIDKTDDSDITTWLTFSFYVGQNKIEKKMLYSEHGKLIKTINQ